MVRDTKMGQDEKDVRYGNVIILIFSFVAISAIVFGFAFINMPNSPPPSAAPSSGKTAAPKPSQKAYTAPAPASPTLDAICSGTDYTSTCKSSLAAFSKKPYAVLKDYVSAAIGVSVNNMENVLKLSTSLSDNGGGKEDRKALIDCNEMITLAIDGLNAAQSAASNTSAALGGNISDVKNWLSSAIAYQQACYDGLVGDSTKLKMKDALQSARKTTSNALAIVQSKFKANIPSKEARNRRLLSVSGVGNDYPSWISENNRRILKGGGLQPDAVVAADGSGTFKTIGEALNSYKPNRNGRYVIYVKAGEYDERVTVTKDHINVYMYGDGRDKTIVSGSKHKMKGVPTYDTATFAVVGNGFFCKSMAFINKATGKEAVALRVQADKAAFYSCKIEGDQGTLYSLANRQFYRECIISGSKNFIFGDSTAVFQKSQILITKPHAAQKVNTITAQGRAERFETTGFVLHNCTITDDAKSGGKIPTYLGQPWKRNSRTVIMQSYIGNVIDRAGWTEGSHRNFTDKLLFAEYGNHGPAADTGKRIKWKGYKIITDKHEALEFTTKHFLQGNSWLNQKELNFAPELV